MKTQNIINGIVMLVAMFLLFSMVILSQTTEILFIKMAYFVVYIAGITLFFIGVIFDPSIPEFRLNKMLYFLVERKIDKIYWRFLIWWLATGYGIFTLLFLCINELHFSMEEPTTAIIAAGAIFLILITTKMRQIMDRQTILANQLYKSNNMLQYQMEHGEDMRLAYEELCRDEKMRRNSEYGKYARNKQKFYASQEAVEEPDK